MEKQMSPLGSSWIKLTNTFINTKYADELHACTKLYFNQCSGAAVKFRSILLNVSWDIEFSSSAQEKIAFI